MTDSHILAKIPEQYFGAWNGRDIDALDDFFAAEFTWEDPLLPCPIDDIEGGRDFLAAGWEGFSDIRFELLGGPMIDEANGRVSQYWRMSATHDGDFAGSPPSGEKVDLAGVDVFTSDDAGKVTALHACYDSVTVLRQLGFFDTE